LYQTLNEKPGLQIANVLRELVAQQKQINQLVILVALILFGFIVLYFIRG
jgi:hypothetical protein